MNRKWFVVVVVIAVAVIVVVALGLWLAPRRKDDVIWTGKTHTNTIGMEFVYIEPTGNEGFMMGSSLSPEELVERFGDDVMWYKEERPWHKVILTKGFYLQTTVVTQRQWKEIMGTETWKGKPFVREGPDYPATDVTWHDAREFIEKLNEKEGTNKYRLPTEAEWEYACRAGTKTAFYWGDTMDGKYCWYRENTWDVGQEYAHEVKKKLPNAWGLYDMSGNVWEWCQDRCWKDYYEHSPEKDPQGSPNGEERVLRGGSWRADPCLCRSAVRIGDAPDDTIGRSGFRVARTP